MDPGRAKHNVKLSKLLSYVLRHGAEKEGIPIAGSGYVLVSDLLKHPKFRNYSVAEIRKVTELNEKQRFALMEKDGELYIRANQGHSLETPDLELTELNPDDVPVAIHGTSIRAANSIRLNGLSRMGRQHIHMAKDLPGVGETISGMRRECAYIVYVDVRQAAKDGLKFYRSANNVILSPGDENGIIHPRYLRIEITSFGQFGHDD